MLDKDLYELIFSSREKIIVEIENKRYSVSKTTILQLYLEILKFSVS